MKERMAAEERLVQFLLGGLPEAEHEAVEERLFTDEPLQAELDKVTDDLIHDYVAGRLGAEERGRFETHFLAAARHRERLDFIQDLTSAVGRVVHDPSRRRATARIATPLVWAAVAAVVLLVVAAALGLLSGPRVPTRVAMATPAPPSPSPATPPPDNAPVRTVRLARDGSAVQSVSVGPATRTVRLEVPVQEGPPSYDAVVRVAGGAEVWRAEGLLPASAGEPLVVAVPARLLTTADYVLSIEGEALRRESPSGPATFRLRVVRSGR